MKTRNSLIYLTYDKIKSYDEKIILESKIVSKQQLSNLKAHLYKQILISLRLNPQHKNVKLHIRGQLILQQFYIKGPIQTKP